MRGWDKKLGCGVLLLLGLGCGGGGNDGAETPASDPAEQQKTGPSKADEATGSKTAPEEITCNVACTHATDCLPNEPYCNPNTGKCQQLPPECVSDEDCSDAEEPGWCDVDGLCIPVPMANCAPGWGMFEGACDNPRCEQEGCPEGTVLNESNCRCDASGSPPSCERKSDCTAAFPYCNRDTKKCQQDPPECSLQKDCVGPDGEENFCHDTGYCEPWRDLRCRPGWGVFEGACDNPACEPEACPEGTVLREADCLCLPDCSYKF